jgi:hypothetical protein
MAERERHRIGRLCSGAGDKLSAWSVVLTALKVVDTPPGSTHEHRPTAPRASWHSSRPLLLALL